MKKKEKKLIIIKWNDNYIRELKKKKLITD